MLPSKLRNQEPELDWANYRQGLNFRFAYQDILKKSVIWQLTVKLHTYVDDASDRYWRRGVLLAYGDCKAVVIADENKKTMDIAIDHNSRNARELLTLIRRDITAINGSNLKATEQIPLLIDGTIVGYANYRYIVAIEQQQSSILLPITDPDSGNEAYHNFQINQLLDGYQTAPLPIFNHQQLTTHLLNIAIKLTESRNDLFNENENQITTRFRDALGFKDYRVADQSLTGESATGKQAGEADMVIRSKDDIAMSLIEAFVLKNCNTSTINSHYRKLTKHYDTSGCSRNFILVYATTANFDGLWQNYSAYCNSEFGGFAPVGNLPALYNNKANIKTGITMFQNREVVHIVVNFYHP